MQQMKQDLAVFTWASISFDQTMSIGHLKYIKRKNTQTFSKDLNFCAFFNFVVVFFFQQYKTFRNCFTKFYNFNWYEKQMKSLPNQFTNCLYGVYLPYKDFYHHHVNRGSMTSSRYLQSILEHFFSIQFSYHRSCLICIN